VIAGEEYSQGSVRLEPGDMVMAFSDAVTEVKSPRGEQLTSEGFVNIARATISRLPLETPLPDVSANLLQAVSGYQGSTRFEDDLTLLLLRRGPS